MTSVEEKLTHLKSPGVSSNSSEASLDLIYDHETSKLPNVAGKFIHLCITLDHIMMLLYLHNVYHILALLMGRGLVRIWNARIVQFKSWLIYSIRDIEFFPAL